jgi:hypothetical protein
MTHYTVAQRKRAKAAYDTRKALLDPPWRKLSESEQLVWLSLTEQ